MTETEFQPFTPMLQDGEGDRGPPALPPPPVRVKKARKKRAARQPSSHTLVVPPKPMPKAKKGRNKRAAKAAPAAFRGAKYTLQEALAIGKELNADDMLVLCSIEEELRSVSKAARTRILAAVGRVFA